MSDSTTLLTRAAVAEMLGISEQTVSRLIRDGELEAIKVNRFVRISKDSVNRYIERGLEYTDRQIAKIATIEEEIANLKEEVEKLWNDTQAKGGIK